MQAARCRGALVLTGIATTGIESGGVECRLAINRRGRVDGFCTIQILGFRDDLPLFDGSLKVARNCALGNGGRLQLSEDGQVMNGIIFDPGLVLNLTGIRVGRRGAGTAANALSLAPQSFGCDLPPQDDISIHAALSRSICQLVEP